MARRNGAVTIVEPELVREMRQLAARAVQADARARKVAANPRRRAAERADAGDPEHAMQAAFFEWVREEAATDPALALFYAVPNQAHVHGKAGMKRGARMKREGRRRGVPDTALPVEREPEPLAGLDRARFIGLRIEFKAPGERPTPDQRWWLGALAEAGHACFVCWSLEAAQAVVRWYIGRSPLHPLNLQDSVMQVYGLEARDRERGAPW